MRLEKVIEIHSYKEPAEEPFRKKEQQLSLAHLVQKQGQCGWYILSKELKDWR